MKLPFRRVADAFGRMRTETSMVTMSSRISSGCTLLQKANKDGQFFAHPYYFYPAFVAHTGFEPVISALRGRCPRPLDECARVWEVLQGRRKASSYAPAR